MANKTQQMQSFIRFYKEQTGKVDVDMHEVAKFAEQKGWTLPKPPSAIDLLAKKFSQAAREETRKDGKTGQPYRVNHAYLPDGNGQGVLWFDIDETPSRQKVLKSAVMRREQMVGDALQLTLDLDHWHRINPNEEPIALPLDLTPDVEWRKNGPDELAA